MMQVLHSKASMVDHWRCHGHPMMSRWSNFGGWMEKNSKKILFDTQKVKEVWHKTHKKWKFGFGMDLMIFVGLFLIGKLFFQGVNLEPRSFHRWEFTCPMRVSTSTVAATRTEKTICWQFQLSMIPVIPDAVFGNIYLQYVWERLKTSNHCIVARKDYKWNPSKKC